ncbi:MAG: hypothetical protein CMM44_11620 [Rhodospirillaceae bacterium]|nr:hypothetical protein [Rhodospirillaceae bacterium]
MKEDQKIIIVFLNSIPYHCAVHISSEGVFELNFLGSNLRNLDEFYNKEYTYEEFKINIKDIKKTINFFACKCMLTEKIINYERNNRGWFKTPESAEFILNYRKTRSRKYNDLNCIEWILLGLEKGGLILPNNILTANQLYKWLKINNEQI